MNAIYELLTSQMLVVNLGDSLVNKFEKISEGFQNGDFIASFSEFMDIHSNYKNKLIHHERIEKLRNMKRKRKLNRNKRNWRVY